jgi:hypothetical protein
MPWTDYPIGKSGWPQIIMANKANLPPLSVWQAESLRFTAFYSESRQASTAEIWKEMVGEDPSETITSGRPKTVQEEGPWLKGKLIAGRTDIRFDWLYAPIIRQPDAIPIAGTEEPMLPGVGSYLEALKPFKAVVEKWLPTSRPANRIAFAVTLIRPVKDHESGYRLLGDYLPAVKVDPLHSRDFIYRINRPRTYQIRDGSPWLINRLSMWSVAFYTALNWNVSSAKPTLVGSAPDFALKIDLDINTPHEDPVEISPERAAMLFDRVVNCANEIAEHGDLE